MDGSSRDGCIRNQKKVNVVGNASKYFACLRIFYTRLVRHGRPIIIVPLILVWKRITNRQVYVYVYFSQ